MLIFCHFVLTVQNNNMFNKGKKRNYRTRKQEQEQEEDNEKEEKNTEQDTEQEESVVSSLQERKELQSFRKRQIGVSAESLLVGEKIELKKAYDRSDPFKIKSGGGLTEMAAKKAAATAITQVSELGTAFSTETNQRDEDVQLLKYIEEGLKKKRGEDDSAESKSKR